MSIINTYNDTIMCQQLWFSFLFIFYAVQVTSLHVIMLNSWTHATSQICAWTHCGSWKNGLQFLFHCTTQDL